MENVVAFEKDTLSSYIIVKIEVWYKLVSSGYCKFFLHKNHLVQPKKRKTECSKRRKQIRQNSADMMTLTIRQLINKVYYF